MGDSGRSLRVGLEVVLIIEPEFGVWSCVTQSHNSVEMCNTREMSREVRINDQGSTLEY